MSLAAASVALVVLVDIATGQGPPQLNSYLTGQPIQYVQPPRPILEPLGYVSREEFDGFKQPESEYDQKDEKKELDKEYGKEATLESKGVVGVPPIDGYDRYKATTAAPGMFSSFSMPFSNAWSKF